MVTLTYVGFHAVFVAPPLFVLASVTANRERSARSVVRTVPVVAILALALAYTTPWDNYLIHRGVWWYGEGVVAGRLWLAPIEEYLFVLLQPIVATLWLALVSESFEWPRKRITMTLRDRLLGVVAAAGIGVAGLAMLTWPATFYMGAILSWAAPVLALQWAVGWRYLVARWRLTAIGTLAPALYFAATDRVAIHYGIWSLSERYTTGLTVGGLPIEEGAFFVVTTLFVVQGLVLYPWVIERWR
ncbi:lycopene cyclase domain-containing protein [Halapricum hydrolyticum]|uniref:Lycopene cyclase domain-containing protein n=1 Tax=Halapricum hydrolyticum TaxID=2979991 RepID=A0AAE3LF00_9EURY|nr:lycopene cyclase domain-containing protein [Halapricum hydrolyticum]MCU4717858.1 lycopene cyclase domain-containing protein [Halapricum hydrolyticum]MCU4727022.1 lycopene cyclase domain-containing protein [Halapricum hydrolyticum]